MKGAALALVFGAMAIGMALTVIRPRSRFTVAWRGAGTIAALAVPAALLGQWAAAVTLLAVGLALAANLASLDARERRRDQHW